MGTGSTIRFKDYDNSIVACVRQHYDGYYEKVGVELANWLKDMTIINGINGSKDLSLKKANGICCLAAQFIREFKTSIGNLYMESIDDEEDYNYIVYIKDEGKNEKLYMSVDEFDGTPEEFIEWVKNKSENEE